jgi:hypothetical protein
VRADPDDPAALASGIERALAESERLARAGLEHARRFTWRAAGETFLRGYAEVARQ